MRKAGIFGLFLASTVMLAACGNGDDENGSGEANGTIKVGVANEEPYGYIDTANNEVTGAAPEIARAVLQSIGYDDIEGTVADFGALIQGVNGGQFDIATAAMDIRLTVVRMEALVTLKCSMEKALSLRREIQWEFIVMKTLLRILI